MTIIISTDPMQTVMINFNRSESSYILGSIESSARSYKLDSPHRLTLEYNENRLTVTSNADVLWARI